MGAHLQATSPPGLTIETVSRTVTQFEMRLQLASSHRMVLRNRPALTILNV
jgi:hypothetical protein